MLRTNCIELTPRSCGRCLTRVFDRWTSHSLVRERGTRCTRWKTKFRPPWNLRNWRADVTLAPPNAILTISITRQIYQRKIIAIIRAFNCRIIASMDIHGNIWKASCSFLENWTLNNCNGELNEKWIWSINFSQCLPEYPRLNILYTWNPFLFFQYFYYLFYYSMTWRHLSYRFRITAPSFFVLLPPCFRYCTLSPRFSSRCKETERYMHTAESIGNASWSF